MSLEKRIRSFLTTPAKGETYELKSGLVSQYKNERKDAIQRVIQAMTIGKDVSALFPDVLKNIATYDIEQKKLVYLYLMNYSSSHPELCILAVNTFIQDTQDANPLIRALAIRTMGCIRVKKMKDYLEPPLLRLLSDDNPYVRKTAVICVGKLYDMDKSISSQFVEKLQSLLNDANPMVVTNTLQTLKILHQPAKSDNLLTCLNESSEWGRIVILEALSSNPKGGAESQKIVERVIPHLQHINPAVVLAAVKCIISHIEYIDNKDIILRKLSAPLISLVSSSIPEAQYVGLKNIRIILEKYPSILGKELRVFFLKYSDPIYLKIEKLDILVRLVDDKNGLLLLGELKEYSMDIDQILITKAIKSIGLVALKLDKLVVKSINILLDLITNRGGDLIINEAIIVLINILRKYPGKNDLLTLIIPVINDKFDSLDSALNSYIFLLGEYPKYFNNIQSRLNWLVENFTDQESSIQLSILSSIVKVHLKENGKYSSTLQAIFDLATNIENADVRDKAYIYWRILSTDSRNSLLAKLPPIENNTNFNPILLNELIQEISTLASVYHKPVSSFIDKANEVEKLNIVDDDNDKEDDILKNENLLDFDDDSGSSKQENAGSLLEELNDLFNTPLPLQTQSTSQNSDDILNLFNTNTLNKGVDKLSIDNKSNSENLLDLF